jgi:hypothetical protein
MPRLQKYGQHYWFHNAPPCVKMGPSDTPKYTIADVPCARGSAAVVSSYLGDSRDVSVRVDELGRAVLLL